MGSEMTHETPAEVYDDVRAERARQDAKWGGSFHDDHHIWPDWTHFIEQRVLEMSRADERGLLRPEGERQLFVEIAALAVAAIESMDRKAALNA